MLAAVRALAKVAGGRSFRYVGCGGLLRGSRADMWRHAWLDLAGGLTAGLQETLKGDQQRSTGKGGIHTQHALHVAVVGRPDTPTKADTGNRP
jgi:hypothetical protein